MPIKPKTYNQIIAYFHCNEIKKYIQLSNEKIEKIYEYICESSSNSVYFSKGIMQFCKDNKRISGNSKLYDDRHKLKQYESIEVSMDRFRVTHPVTTHSSSSYYGGTSGNNNNNNNNNNG